MVRLTRIYTRRGDTGETDLGDMTRVKKTSDRVAAIGDVDEANAALGVAIATGLVADHAQWLVRVQNDLFDLGADIAVPIGGDDRDRLRITPEQVTRLEHHCDTANADLAALTSFILPGGTPQAAALHLARSVCRRAERSVVRLGETETINPQTAAYLNRLSDLLFILARHANDGGRADVLWVPGAERAGGDGD